MNDDRNNIGIVVDTALAAKITTITEIVVSETHPMEQIEQ